MGLKSHTLHAKLLSLAPPFPFDRPACMYVPYSVSLLDAIAGATRAGFFFVFVYMPALDTKAKKERPPSTTLLLALGLNLASLELSVCSLCSEYIGLGPLAIR